MNSQSEYIWSPEYEKFCVCNLENCRCEENNEYEWVWDRENATRTIVLSDDNLDVKFHNGYSYGTAAIRGNKLLEKGKHHYWEVEMLSPTYGTDIMVGVGTSKVDLNSANHVFCSFLGLDQESFGFSYQGYIQHNGQNRCYSKCFGQGTLVGVHLDTWRGTLQFFLNRKPLGIAFSGLRNIELYPMVSSTAAQSKMRLIHSCSAPVSLQMECLSVLKPSDKAYLSTTFPGLRHLSESIFADILNTNRNDEEQEMSKLKYLTECMFVDEFDFALVGAREENEKCARNNNNSVCTMDVTLNSS
ncbi:SPRY domain-containing SOCS box protein 3 [Xylocopa sonorina]|uniref:SPRY domain-containing SOCS box protein 3 n=1 Tax=Xylocopa sonorina TaxID=1818115 RepID=UPI00403A9196